MYATYSPEDNKLRLYPDARLDEDEYSKARSLGFRWAPKQELFVCPSWSPAAADWLEEMAEEVGDEDTSLADRAEDRAERFDGYKERRAADAESAHAAVSRITDGIPLGQPILVGHHSEKHARRDAQKIENGMRRTVRMWETSSYWESRARGVLASASYKDLPGVRARRIKKLEAERRKRVRYYTPNEPVKRLNQTPWDCPVCGEYRSCDHPEAKQATPHVWCGAGRGGYWVSESSLAAIEKGEARWIAHLDLRLAYEKALLGEQGESALLNKPKRPKQPPLLNYRVPEGVELQSQNIYHRGEVLTFDQVEMTKADWKKIRHWDGGGTKLAADKSHRFRTTTRMRVPGYQPPEGLDGTARSNHSHHSVAVFLTDSKEHPKPEAGETVEPRRPAPPEPRHHTPSERTKFDDMRESLRGGVQTVVADQLFETPNAVIVRMMERAELEGLMSVLEPSAGTGRLARACFERTGYAVQCVEVNPELAAGLRQKGYPVNGHGDGHTSTLGDFLTFSTLRLGTFDRVIMNPPFKNGTDIAHILHARTFLKPSGRLVAICANGSRQADKLKPLADTWEELPEDSFRGTGVRAVLLTMSAEHP